MSLRLCDVTVCVCVLTISASASVGVCGRAGAAVMLELPRVGVQARVLVVWAECLPACLPARLLACLLARPRGDMLGFARQRCG